MAFIVALSGIDGSGKTTATKETVSLLNRLGKQARYHYELRFLFLRPQYDFFSRIAGSRRAHNLHEAVVSRMFQNAIIHSALYYLMMWLDFLMTYLWFRIHDGIVIFDRYSYDFLTRFEYLNYSNGFVKFLFSRFPRPNLLLMLDTDPRLAYERRKGVEVYDANYYVAQRNRMLRVARVYKYDRVLKSFDESGKTRTPSELAHDIVEMTVRAMRRPSRKESLFKAIRGFGTSRWK